MTTWTDLDVTTHILLMAEDGSLLMAEDGRILETHDTNWTPQTSSTTWTAQSSGTATWTTI